MSSGSQWKVASRHVGTRFVLVVIAIAIGSLFLHAVYITREIRSLRTSFDPCLQSQSQSTVHVPVSPPEPQQQDSIPDIFIYRRTKKTGSSAMLDALLHALEPYDYLPIYVGGEQANEVVRAESLRRPPRRLFMLQHNQVLKSTDPERRSVIADTFRDGYEQMTSFCRYSKHIKECGKEVIECLESDDVIVQNRYRWAGRTQEDADTYIDLPLSTAHPALSTTVLRHVFPNAVLELDNYNVANSTCPEIPEIRRVYDEHYKTLDKQIERLRRRMLIMAGYPTQVDTKSGEKITLADMIDAAEESEKFKYNIRESQKQTSSIAKSHSAVLSELRVWTKSENGSIVVLPKYRGSGK